MFPVVFHWGNIYWVDLKITGEITNTSGGLGLWVGCVLGRVPCDSSSPNRWPWYCCVSPVIFPTGLYLQSESCNVLHPTVGCGFGRCTCSTQTFVFAVAEIAPAQLATLVAWLVEIGICTGGVDGVACTLVSLAMATEHNKRVLHVVFHVNGRRLQTITDNVGVRFESAVRETRLPDPGVEDCATRTATPRTVGDLLLGVHTQLACCGTDAVVHPAAHVAAPSACTHGDAGLPAWYWYHGSGTATLPSGPGSTSSDIRMVQGDMGMVQGGASVPQTTVALFPLGTGTAGSMLVLRDALGVAARHQFDVAGLRLLFLSREDCDADVDLQALVRPGAGPVGSDIVTVVAVALRRANAVAVWNNLVGPTDAVLAQQMHPGTLRAIHGTTRDDVVLVCSRSQAQVCGCSVGWGGGHCCIGLL